VQSFSIHKDNIMLLFALLDWLAMAGQKEVVRSNNLKVKERRSKKSEMIGNVKDQF